MFVFLIFQSPQFGQNQPVSTKFVPATWKLPDASDLPLELDS